MRERGGGGRVARAGRGRAGAPLGLHAGGLRGAGPPRALRQHQPQPPARAATRLHGASQRHRKDWRPFPLRGRRRAGARGRHLLQRPRAGRAGELQHDVRHRVRTAGGRVAGAQDGQTHDAQGAYERSAHRRRAARPARRAHARAAGRRCRGDRRRRRRCWRARRCACAGMCSRLRRRGGR